MNKQKAKAIAAEIIFKNTVSPDQLPDDDYHVLLVESLFSANIKKTADKLFSDSDEEIGKSFRHVP